MQSSDWQREYADLYVSRKRFGHFWTESSGFGAGIIGRCFSIWLCKICLSGISKGVGRMIKKRGGKKYEI